LLAVVGAIVVTLALASSAAAAVDSSAATARACSGTVGTVNGARTCLRLGRRCSRAYRADYLSAGRDCVRNRGRYVLRRASPAALRQGRVLALPRSGLPTFNQALWEFDQTVAPLPGVRVPRGAVGREASGTAAIAALDRYRRRLTRRQRAVFNRALRPAGPSVTISPTGGPARAHGAVGLGDLPAITIEALARLRAHGIVFTHPIKLTLSSRNKGLERMNTLAQWLYKLGSACAIEVRPSGARASLILRRRFLLHELMHCAAAEQVTRAQFDSQPQYVQEGLAEWGSYRVSVEWQGTVGPGNWWSTYLASPQLSLFARSYDAVGFWSLLEHEGVNVWASQPALVKHGGSGNAADPLQAAEDAAPPTFESDWGSTLATASTLGARWDLAGPDMPRRSEPQTALGNGASWGHVVARAGGYEGRLDISADVIRVQSLSSIHGWLRDSAGADHDLPTDSRYCTDGKGCVCPNGQKLGYAEIPPGEARVGFADASQTGAVVVTGESLDQHCKTRHKGALEILASPGLTVLATFNSGTCSVTKGKFRATARDGAWSITVKIDHFVDYDTVYPLQHGSDPGFTIGGPGGPYSNRFAGPAGAPASGQIRFYPDGRQMRLGFEYAWNSSGTDAVLPLGGMNCKRPSGR
jgi:hypothetical protein